MKSYLIGAIVGSIIGYITNFIAIKMLFKPHNEKRIFGVKVPFTPGLIPKEKSRIAKSVGDTVGMHLITSETIVESLKNPEIKVKINDSIRNKVKKVYDEGLSLNDKLKNTLGNSYESLKIKFKGAISNKVILYLRDDKFKNKVEEIIFYNIMKELQQEPVIIKKLISNNEVLENKIISLIEDYKKSEDFSNQINSIIDGGLEKLNNSNKKISEIIPEDIFKSIDIYIISEKDKISFEVKNALRQPNVADKIKNSISAGLSGGMSGFMSMFVNPDIIYGKVLTIVDNYLEDENNKLDMCKALSTFVRKASNINISDILVGIDEESKKVFFDFISNIIKNSTLSSEVIFNQLNKIKDKVNTIESYDRILRTLDINYDEKIKKFLGEKILGIVNCDNSQVYIDGFINEIVEKVMDTKLNTITGDMEEVVVMLCKVVENTYDQFVDNDAIKIAELLNISGIVEEKINSFDVDYAEKIILDIANKELNAITWLGAVLGAVLGVLSPLLSTLYM